MSTDTVDVPAGPVGADYGLARRPADPKPLQPQTSQHAPVAIADRLPPCRWALVHRPSVEPAHPMTTRRTSRAPTTAGAADDRRPQQRVRAAGGRGDLGERQRARSIAEDARGRDATERRTTGRCGEAGGRRVGQPM